MNVILAKKAKPLGNLKEVAARLKEARKRLSMTQTAVADLIGLPPQYIQRYEAGEVEPPLGVLAPLARIYTVSIDFLITGVDSSPNGQAVLPLRTEGGKDWISMPAHDPRPLSQPDRAALEDALTVLRSPEVEGGYSESLYNNIKSFAHSVRLERQLTKSSPYKGGKKNSA